jgi:hypothetical protein
VSDWSTVCEIARALPGAEETTTYGQPAFKVGGKLFVWMSPSNDAVGALALRVDPEEKAPLIASRTDRCFSTPHYEGHPILLVRMDRMEPDELAELIEDAWLLCAPKRLLDGFLAEPGG